jgi:hypothetical protein
MTDINHRFPLRDCHSRVVSVTKIVVDIIDAGAFLLEDGTGEILLEDGITSLGMEA